MEHQSNCVPANMKAVSQAEVFAEQPRRLHNSQEAPVATPHSSALSIAWFAVPKTATTGKIIRPGRGSLTMYRCPLARTASIGGPGQFIQRCPCKSAWANKT